MKNKPQRAKQLSFLSSKGRYQHSHGGELRCKKIGRSFRPLDSKMPLHLVFKCNRERLKAGLRSPQTFLICTEVLRTYARRFYIKIEQISIQADHIHALIRGGRRAHFQHFFRVVAGQIAQRLQNAGLFHANESSLTLYNQTAVSKENREKTIQKKLWKWRPFTRVIIGWKAYETARDYIQLNELEAGGRPYRKERLSGLSPQELRDLWTN